MSASPATAIATVVGVGVGAQWLANRARIPSILLLLAAGLIVGPGFGIVNPAEQFGPLLFPLVSLGVGLLLFEGGLELSFRGLEVGRSTVLRLVTIGVLLTWIVGWLSITVLFDITQGEAAVLAAVLVVSGPTVVLPLLGHVRPRQRLANILRWEAILIDPVGATLAVVVLEAVVRQDGDTTHAALEVAATGLVGVAIGAAFASGLLAAVSRHWISDHLHSSVGLATVVVAFTLANSIYPEAGLFTTTTMGIVMANQRQVPVGHIADFGAQLGPLILAGLFITLGASIEPGALDDVLLPSLVLLAVLLGVARPLTVLAGTVGTDLARNERLFLTAIAPRGVVAAAVASLFALDLTEADRPFPELVPVTFVVIVGSVLVTGLGARPAARRLRIDEVRPRGIALLGNQPWLLDLAGMLVDLDVPVLLLDPESSERTREVAATRGFLVFPHQLDSDHLGEALAGVGVGQALVASTSAEINTFAVDRLAALVGRANVFRLAADEVEGTAPSGGTERAAAGRQPFREGITQKGIDALWAKGGRLAINDGPVDTTEGVDLVFIDEATRASVATGSERDKGLAIVMTAR